MYYKYFNWGLIAFGQRKWSSPKGKFVFLEFILHRKSYYIPKCMAYELRIAIFDIVFLIEYRR